MLTRADYKGTGMPFPLAVRFALVAGIALVLLAPLSMIKSKIAERRDRAAAVHQAFAQETSGPQALAGPFLALSCEETYTDERVEHLENGKLRTVREKKRRACATGLFVPRQLTIEASVPVEGRYRGIYPIRLYRAKLDISGSFAVPPPPASSADSARSW